MAGLVAPGEENLRDPFEVAHRNIRANLFPEFPDQGICIALPEFHMTAGEGEAPVFSGGGLQQHVPVVHADSRHPVAEDPVLRLKQNIHPIISL